MKAYILLISVDLKTRAEVENMYGTYQNVREFIEKNNLGKFWNDETQQIWTIEEYINVLNDEIYPTNHWATIFYVKEEL